MENFANAQSYYDNQLPPDCQDAAPGHLRSVRQAEDFLAAAIRRGNQNELIDVTGRAQRVELSRLLFWFDKPCCDSLLRALCIASSPDAGNNERDARVVAELHQFIRLASAEYALDYCSHEDNS